MKIDPARLRKFALATAGLIVLVLVVVFVFRDALLQKRSYMLNTSLRTPINVN